MPEGFDQQQTEPSLEHPTIELVLRLRRRSEREASGLFFAEGVRFIKQAVEQRSQIVSLVVSRKLLMSPLGQKTARLQKQAGIPCLQVSRDIFQTISLSHRPQGIGAILRQRWTPLRRADPRNRLCWLALTKIQSPGNLGTIIRTCEAIGAAGLILIGEDVDPFDPAAVRASMGALFRQRFVRCTHDEFRRWVKRHRCKVVGTSPSARIECSQVTFRPPTVLLMGNERKGISPAERGLCNVMARIPMVGKSDSLNVAVAAGIMLYEVFRHRRS